MKKIRFKKNIKSYPKKCGMALTLTVLIVNVGANAFDLITPSGVKKTSNSKHLKFYQLGPSNAQFKKAPNKKPKRKMTNGCVRKNAYSGIIGKASQRYKVDERLIKAIISTESCFNSKAVSPKGAQGLMQLMPLTAERFGVINSFDPAQNIMGGVKYLQFLLKRFKGKPSLAIAAYNAGEGAVDHYSGIPPYKETQNYVKKVLALLGREQTNIFYNKVKNKKIERKKEKGKVTTKCTSSKKIRNYTYAHYGARYVKRYYVIRSNDTLKKISHRVGLNIEIIQVLNTLKEGNEFKKSRIRTLLLSDCPL